MRCRPGELEERRRRAGREARGRPEEEGGGAGRGSFLVRVGHHTPATKPFLGKGGGRHPAAGGRGAEE